MIPKKLKPRKAFLVKSKDGSPNPFQIERFSLQGNGKTLVRKIFLRRRRTQAIRIALPRRITKTSSQDALAAAADLAYLTRKSKTKKRKGDAIHTVDLFSSSGFMSQGAAD